MTEQFANQPPIPGVTPTTLPASAITLGQQCNIGDAVVTLSGLYGGLPTTGTFRLIFPDTGEIMIGTGRTGPVVNVTRGAEGTVAATHLQGAPVFIGLTMGAIAQLKQDVAASGFDLAVGTGGATTTATLPTGKVLRVLVDTRTTTGHTPFVGAGAVTLSLGSAATPTLILGNSVTPAVDLTLNQLTVIELLVTWPTNVPIVATVSGSPSAGSAEVFVVASAAQT